MVTGSGTSGDPYMLYNLTDLESISTLGLDKYYKLANDIDASATQDASYNSGAGWLPVGNSSTPFTGNFNGNGYTISGLYINRPSTNYVGLFGALYGTITNVTLDTDENGYGSIEGADYVGGICGGLTRTSTITYCNVYIPITGVNYVGGILGFTGTNSTYILTLNHCNFNSDINATSYAGGIVGLCNFYHTSTTISYCTVQGNITITGSRSAGGIAGHFVRSVSYCTVYNITINSPTSSDYTGGIVGSLGYTGTITQCKVRGNIYGGNAVGGIIGGDESLYSGNYDIITQCMFKGNITGTGMVGGILGDSKFYNANSKVYMCYSSGTIVATGTYVGGLIGYSRTNPQNSYSNMSVQGDSYVAGLLGGHEFRAVLNCYSCGAVSGNSYVYGLVAKNSSGSNSNSFWDTQTSGQSSSILGTGKTTAEMKTQSTYTSWDFSIPIWVIDSYQNDSYPYLDDILPDPWNVYASDLAMSGEQVNIPGRINLNDSATSEEQSLISFKGFQLIDNGVDSNLVSILNNFTLNDSGTINESITFLKNLEDNCSSFETVYSYFYSLINDSNISSESLQLLNTFLLTDSRTSEENIILMKRIEDSGISDELVDCTFLFLVRDSITSSENVNINAQINLLERRRMLESVLKIDNDFTLTDVISSAEELGIANVRYVGDEANSDVQVYVDVTAVYHVVELVDDVNSTEKVNLIVRLSERDEREEFLTSLKGIHPEEE